MEAVHEATECNVYRKSDRARIIGSESFVTLLSDLHVHMACQVKSFVKWSYLVSSGSHPCMSPISKTRFLSVHTSHSRSLQTSTFRHATALDLGPAAPLGGQKAEWPSSHSPQFWAQERAVQVAIAHAITRQSRPVLEPVACKQEDSVLPRQALQLLLALEEVVGHEHR